MNPAQPRARYIAELSKYIQRTIGRLKTDRLFGALFHVRVIEDIAADVAKEQQALAAVAYTAEQADREAIRLIEEAASDGFSQADTPALCQALRHIRRSAAGDHRLAEALG